MRKMDLLKSDLRRTPILLAGFLLLSAGIVLTKRSLLGMSSWGVFHQGLATTFHTTFGIVTVLLGLLILAISVVLLKTKVGIGTICNVLFVGFIIDGMDIVYTFIPTSKFEQAILLSVGILLMTFGRSLYISSELGEGPRDGLFVGLSRVTQIDVKYIKPAIEFSVLFIGVLLGGKIGVGTVITIVLSGYLVHFFFYLLGFNPKEHKQRSIQDYRNQRIKKGA